MLHPIGSRPPGVYWRRRAAMLAAVLLMIGLTWWVAVRRDGNDSAAGGAGSGTPSGKSSSHSAAPTSAHPTSRHPSTPAKTSRTSPPARTLACKPSALKVAAVVEHRSYLVGDKPIVLLQVTNTGRAPCVQDLADSQIELRVYNGESRVWGSHDCTIEPGKATRTLAVGQPVRVSVVWSGLSSQPKCAGTRQRVGAGTYTLYALLAGHEGTAAQFSVS